MDDTLQDLVVQLHSEDVDGAKTVRFVCHETGVATDPASGAQLLIKLELKNTSVI